MSQLNEDQKGRLMQVKKSTLRWYIVLVYPTVAVVSFLYVGIAKSLDWSFWAQILLGLTGGVVVITIGKIFIQPILNCIRHLLPEN